MSFVKGLKCKECGKVYSADPIYVCEYCFGPLEVDYDYEAIRKNISRESIEAGNQDIWRYADLLPADMDKIIPFHVGMTPLVKAQNLGDQLGIKNLYIKNDTVNPTGSFKDRVVSMAVAKAHAFGFDTISCASTGNLANSTAALCAKYKKKCIIFIPHDLEMGKVLGTVVYGAKLVKVKGNYDDVNKLCGEIAGKYPWAFVNVNVRPYYAEGSKTIAFETAEQLGFELPDHVVSPIASGSLLTKIHKGFREMVDVGLIKNDKPVRISGAQPAGCNPVYQAWKDKTDFVKPVKPSTIAKSLAIGNPADGWYAIQVVNKTNGAIEEARSFRLSFMEVKSESFMTRYCARVCLRPASIT